MAALTTIFLFCLITLILAQCNYETALSYFQKSVYNLTLQLVRRISLKTENHFVASVLSPWTLLSVMSLHSTDTTRQEIQELLQLHPHSCLVYFYLELVNQVTTKPDNPASSMLERSSTIFFDANLDVQQSFFDDLSKGGLMNSRIMYFVDRSQTARSINEHVRSFTDGTINATVTPDELVGLSTVTIDALAFKGTWKVSFPYEETETDAFYDDEGKQIGVVYLMYLCGSFNMTSSPQIEAKVLELPYYGDERYSMLIFLPENVTLTPMLDLMDKINISAIFNSFERNKPLTVTVCVPRFKISSIFKNWRDFLISIGLSTIFEKQEVHYPGIFSLFLNNLIQKVALKVGEDGVDIGREPATLMQSRFMFEQFVANRPFMFMVVDRIHHVPLFTGVYSKPSLYA